MAESFGQLLKRHRLAADLSQESLAERACLSVETVSALERGVRHAPYKATLDLLTRALALDDDARLEIETAARLARAHTAKTRESVKSNLPPQLTSFVEREKVVADLRELVQSHRLVTLVGTGGVGKTRAAHHIGAQMVDRFPDGVWVAELAPTTDPSQVADVVARAVRVQESPQRPIIETLLSFLKRKRLLLVLDNCEHVIDRARRVVAAILHDCPDVCVLATSREGLSIAGEQAYRIPSLPVPPSSESLSIEDLLEYGSVQLFNDRAISANNCFALTVESSPYVAAICRRLDGIPLAIELAAARVKALSPRELTRQLDESFHVLTGGDRSALTRHQTMRALIDWSYDLLCENERALFRKLSIFAGGFTLDTTTAVCGGPDMDEIVVLDLLSSLVDKSLVQAEVVGADSRYRLLESTRQYAREKLRDADEEETMAHAHARTFLGLAEHLFDAWEITPDHTLHAQAEAELENFRAALRWALDARGDVLLGQRLACALRRVWFSFGAAEGRRWVQAARQCVSADTPDTMLALLDLADGSLAGTLSENKASLALADRALARYCKLDDAVGIARARLTKGEALVYLGEIAEGEALVRQTLDVARSLGLSTLVLMALDTLAFARKSAGDLPGVRRYSSEVLAVAQTVGAERSAASAVLVLAEAEFQGGDAPTALHLANETLAVHSRLGDTRSVAIAEYNMAAYLVALGRYDEARTAARRALPAARDLQFSSGLAWALQHLAAIAALCPSADVPVEDRRRAARVLGFVDARLKVLEKSRTYTEQQEYDKMIAALRDALGEDELAKLIDEGRGWNEDRAVAEAMLI